MLFSKHDVAADEMVELIRLIRKSPDASFPSDDDDVDDEDGIHLPITTNIFLKCVPGDCSTGVLEAIAGYSDGQFRFHLLNAGSGDIHRDSQYSGMSGGGSSRSTERNQQRGKFGGDAGEGEEDPGNAPPLLGTLADVLLGNAPLATVSPSSGGLRGPARATAFSMRMSPNSGRGSLGITGFHVYLLLLCVLQGLETKFQFM